MKKLHLLVVVASFLSSSAYAGDVALTCSGTRSTPGVGRSPASMNLVIHKGSGTVTSSTKYFGVSSITKDAEGSISFEGKTWSGVIDRHSGHAYLRSRPPHDAYNLTCKSVGALF